MFSSYTPNSLHVINKARDSKIQIQTLSARMLIMFQGQLNMVRKTRSDI